MAEHYYAYLPVLMQQMYEGISEDFDRWEGIVEPLFVRGVNDGEKAVILQEIDRLLLTHRKERDLLQQVWRLGARDFPKGSIRKHLRRVQVIVDRSRAPTDAAQPR